MKVLIDMCFSSAMVELLEKAGINAVHWSTLGRGDAPDSEIMKFAADKRYAVLTHDLDFGAILAATIGQAPECSAGSKRKTSAPMRPGESHSRI